MNLKPFREPCGEQIKIFGDIRGTYADKHGQFTDCRSEEGITVGLIDSLISICRVLAPRIQEPQSHAIKEALQDLRNDSDIYTVCHRTEAEKEARLHQLQEIKKELFNNESKRSRRH